MWVDRKGKEEPLAAATQCYTVIPEYLPMEREVALTVGS